MTLYNTCKSRVDVSIAIRFIITVALVLLIRKFFLHNKYLLLIIVARSFLTEYIDMLITKYYIEKANGTPIKCTDLYYYQISDKVMDLIVYIIIYFGLHNDEIFGGLIIWRFMGILLFSQTKNRRWLIPFFDFIREYLVYKFIFGKNLTYLPFFILAKVGYVYYEHVYRLSAKRNLNPTIND